MATVKDFKVSLSIAGEDFGEWDQQTGGEYDADETKYTPADGVQRTYLGNPTIGNITLERDYQPARDGQIVKRKAALQGQSAVGTVLDRGNDGNYQQNRLPYRGLVKMITPPEPDSNSADVAKIQVEISVGGTT